MTNAELIACIQAEEQGKKVEFRGYYLGSKWTEKPLGVWNTMEYAYRIRRDPSECCVKLKHDVKSGTKWVRILSQNPMQSEWEPLVEEIR